MKKGAWGKDCKRSGRGCHTCLVSHIRYITKQNKRSFQICVDVIVTDGESVLAAADVTADAAATTVQSMDPAAIIIAVIIAITTAAMAAITAAAMAVITIAIIIAITIAAATLVPVVTITEIIAAATAIAADTGILAGATGPASATVIIRDITTASRTDAMHAGIPAAVLAEMRGSCLWPMMAVAAVPVIEQESNGGGVTISEEGQQPAAMCSRLLLYFCKR